jgi:hypothetical protein
MANELVVACRDTAELLELDEHGFNAGALPVEARIASVLDGPVEPWRHRGPATGWFAP